MGSFQPTKEFEPIQEYYKNNEDNETEEDEQFRNVWPYKKWLWRTDKNFENKSFDPNKTLEHFIDDKDTTVGRAWYITELRYKSNEDLWRLWYVLLRERNMLNSMRFACRASKRQMPNYGRLKKVAKTMFRLQYVWKERATLKLANLEQEQKRKQEKARIDAIEYRRAKLLEKREIIKAMFFKHVESLHKDGQDVKHLFPKINLKRRKANSKRHCIIDAAMRVHPVLNATEPTMIPKDLQKILDGAMQRLTA